MRRGKGQGKQGRGREGGKEEREEEGGRGKRRGEREEEILRVEPSDRFAGCRGRRP